MCYMMIEMINQEAGRVGVRELRQNLSVHLARVTAGETLEVTDRGVPVAILAPIVAGESPLSRLEREGRLIRGHGELLAAGGRHRGPSRRWASRALRQEREDRRL